MLPIGSENLYRSFPNYFLKGTQDSLCQLYSLGWQMRTSTKYDWDGMKRPADKGQCIFQYTISGFGRLEYGDKSVILDEESAFIVSIPDNHRYYLPADSEKWEFIFITLTGDYVLEEWQRLQKQYGNVIKLSPKSNVIQFLWKTYWNFVENNVTDGYQTSAIAYEFIMQLLRSLNVQGEEQVEGNRHIESAIEFMKQNLHNQISLDDITAATNISKYHFSRLFTHIMGISPWDYLNNMRMEKAVYLLQTHSYKISEVAEMVGFSTTNYFDKVFKKSFGISPGTFMLMYQGTDETEIH